MIANTPTANLRVGPGTEQAIVITLKEGDVVTVEKLEGEWYQVTAAEGQKGYIHKNLIKVGEPQKVATTPAAAPDGAKSEVNKPTPTPSTTSTIEAPGKLATPPPPAPTPAPEKSVTPQPAAQSSDAVPTTRKSTALIRLIEGRETEAVIGFGIAVLFFVFGWICGGIYSLRRDRVRRSRLVF